jgi:isopentenyl-diphosphate delta-isomerase type 1
MSEKKELLEIVDHEGKVIGIAERSELHTGPSLIHRVVHVLVFNKKGELLLQKRSMLKDVAPGKWDTSVGGHINPGEDIIAAANREMEEELGIKVQRLDFLYTYLFTSHIESELVSTFSCIHDSGFHFNKEEIDELAFWELKKIRDNMGRKMFSNHFEKEIANYFKALSPMM